MALCLYTDCGAPRPAFGFPRGMRDFASLDATCDTPEAVEVHVYSWASSSFVEVVRPLPTHCPAQRPVTQALSGGSSNAGPKDSVSLYDSTARSGWHYDSTWESSLTMYHPPFSAETWHRLSYLHLISIRLVPVHPIPTFSMRDWHPIAPAHLIPTRMFPRDT